MKRFRFTLLAICAVLLFLGGSDLCTLLRNPEPLAVSLEELERGNPPRDWLTVTGGTLDLREAISTSGTVDIEALLVPLKTDPSQKEFRVLVETRDPALVGLLKSYYFALDTEQQQQQFFREHQEEFYPGRAVTGMIAGGLVASGNRDRLKELAGQLGMKLQEEVIFLSEGKEPARWRGIFFFAAGLLGLIKVLLAWKRGTGPGPA